jgi:ankyrin repeat protein
MKLSLSGNPNFTKILVVATVLFVLVTSALLIGYVRQTDIHGAIRCGDVAALKAMLAKSPDLIHKTGDMGATPLHTAAEEGNVDIIKLLIEDGLHTGVVDWMSNTALHVASAKGHTQAAAVLHEKGADPGARNNQNDTPLHLAADAGHVDVARMLIEAGADMNAKDYRNQTPLKRARDRGRNEVASLLLKHGAKEQ